MMPRLAFDASNLALVGGLISIVYLEVGLRVGPDQLAELMVGGLWLIPVLLVLEFILGLAIYRPVHQVPRECFAASPMVPERGPALGQALFISRGEASENAGPGGG